MNPLQFAVPLAAGLVLAAAAQAQTPSASAPPAQAKPAEPAGSVDPQATQALDKMAAYLRTLQSFEISTQTSLDLVTDAGQRIQLDGTAAYKVRRPNGFVIAVNTDWKKRTYYYDGQKFTIYAPELGFYANAEAPPTIAQTLDVIADKFGIVLPIEDLFRWNDPSSRRTEPVESAMYVGTATIDGTPTDHYAFRQGDVDWQIWIQTGDKPLPRKLVIVDRTDLAHPAYSARLTWKLNPSLTDADFAFRPASDAKAIHLTTLGR